MYSIFKALCDKKGVTPYRVAKETGISPVTFTNWKNGKYVPKNDKLKLIADYFHCSIDYLRYGTEIDYVEMPIDDLNTLYEKSGSDKMQVINKLLTLDDIDFAKIEERIDMLLESDKYKKDATFTSAKAI